MKKVRDVVKVDGIGYNIFIPRGGIKRTFDVLDGDQAGRFLDGSIFRDIIGTFYGYTVNFDASYTSKEEYDRLYEVLSAPVDYHTLQIPYGQQMLIFEAYTTHGEDTLQWIDEDGNHWQGLQIQFVAQEPQRRAL